MITRSQILTTARTLVGTPYHHQGRLPGVGLDCVGVLVVVGRSLGLTRYDAPTYPRYPDGSSFCRQLETGGMVPIPAAEVGVGDIITFWYRREQWPQHCAIATDLGMIHAFATARKVVEHGIADFWRERVVTCYRYPGIDPTPYKSVPWAGPIVKVPETVTEMVRRQLDAMGKPCCGG